MKFRHPLYIDLWKFALTLLLVSLVIPGIIAAQEPSTPIAEDDVALGPSLVFRPADSDHAGAGFIDLRLNPGETTMVKVVLGNGGDEDFEAITYAADVYSLRNGGFGMRAIEEPQTGATLWLEYPTERFDSTVDEAIEREIVVTVPSDAKSGEYVTAVAMETVNPIRNIEDSGLIQFSEYYRTAIGIRIVVPGELTPVIEFGTPQYVIEGAIPAIVVPVHNSGNQQMSPSGELQVFNTDGELLMSAPVRMNQIFGGHETELWIGLSQPLPDGEYEIAVALQDESKGVRAELPPTTFVASNDDATTVADLPPIRFTTSSAEPMPAAENVQFLAVDATITNTTEEPIPNAQLSLIATVDGEEVERFPISQSLSVPPGETDVSTRYIPLTGWTSGEWEFELLLETVEGSGAAVVVDRVTLETTVTIP